MISGSCRYPTGCLQLPEIILEILEINLLKFATGDSTVYQYIETRTAQSSHTLQSPFSGSSNVWSMPIRFSLCSMHSSEMARERCESNSIFSTTALRSSRCSISAFISRISCANCSFQNATSDRRSSIVRMHPDVNSRSRQLRLKVRGTLGHCVPPSRSAYPLRPWNKKFALILSKRHIW